MALRFVLTLCLVALLGGACRAQNAGGNVGATGLDTVETAVRQGNAFNTSATCTSVVATYCPTVGGPPVVPTGYALNVILSNPVGSGYRCLVYERRIDDNVQVNGVPLQYMGITMPAALTSPMISSTGTSILYGTSTSVCSFTAAVTTTAAESVSASGAATFAGFLPTGGSAFKLMQIRILNPGQSIGNVVIGGLGSILGAVTTFNASTNVTYYWTQEKCLPSGC